MAAGGLPTVQVLLDDGTGTFPYDLTAMTVGGDKLVRVGYDLNRGRQDEQSDVTPGAIRSLVLNNTDGRFTLNSTIIATPSPIRPDNRIRVKVTANAVTRDRYTGYVQEWPTDWPDGSDLLCEVTLAATDAQARAERRELLSVIEEEILLDSPILYYVFGEAAGSAAAGDSSGNQGAPLAVTGSGSGVTFGSATGPATDGYTAVQFAGGKYLANKAALESVPSLAPPLSIETFFNVAAAADDTVLAAIGETGFINVLKIFSDGHTFGGFYNSSGSTFGASGATNKADAQTHHLAITRSATQAVLYEEGTAVTTNPAVNSQGASLNVWAGAYDGAGPSTGVFNFNHLTGTLAHLAVFGSVLSAARVAAHAQAGLTGFAGESGTARLTRLAGYAGIPVGTLDASLTNVAFKDIAGTSAADAIRDVAAAEFGIVFIDGSGNLTFHNRNRPQAKIAPDITLTADQLDPGTMIPVDMQGVINYFAATAVGGTGANQVAWNKVSEKGDGTVTNPGHGRYSGGKAYLVQSDQEALDRANWIVANHADPLPRVPVLKIDLLTLDAATQNALLAAEANTWIRITGLPSQAAGGTTADLLVQGFSEHMDPLAWDLSFNVVARSVFQAWILGDATYGVLGSTTRLGI